MLNKHEFLSIFQWELSRKMRIIHFPHYILHIYKFNNIFFIHFSFIFIFIHIYLSKMHNMIE